MLWLKTCGKLKTNAQCDRDCSLFWCQSYLNNHQIIVIIFFSSLVRPHCGIWQGTGWRGVSAAEMTRNGDLFFFYAWWECQSASYRVVQSTAAPLKILTGMRQWSHCDNDSLGSWYCTCASSTRCQSTFMVVNLSASVTRVENIMFFC